MAEAGVRVTLNVGVYVLAVLVPGNSYGVVKFFGDAIKFDLPDG